MLANFLTAADFCLQRRRSERRAHWEGRILVVETTNFTPDAAHRGANPTLPSSSDSRACHATNYVDGDDRWGVDVDAAIDDRPAARRPLAGVMPYECHKATTGRVIS